MMDDSTTSRDFMVVMAQKINKQPADVEKFIVKFEESWIETVGDIKQLSEDQWKSLGMPMGLVNQIKKEIAPEETQIDSSGVQSKLQQVAAEKIARQQEQPVDSMVTYTRCLDELKKILYDSGDKQAHQDTVKTLFKILENLILKENDIKVRMLPKTNKSVQQKILAFPQAIKYLETAGFNFSKAETIELTTFDKSLIQQGLDTISLHIVSLGGKVETPSTFDGTKQSKSSTTGDKYTKPPGLDKDEEDKYDPTKVSEMTEFIKKQRLGQLEKTVESRDVKIFNAQGTGQTLK